MFNHTMKVKCQTGVLYIDFEKTKRQSTKIYSRKNGQMLLRQAECKMLLCIFDGKKKINYSNWWDEI